MKTCSKCKRDLDESCFVKSDRYLDGLYPSCRECRKVTRLKTLNDHPICSRCGIVPHVNGSPYCDGCFRFVSGRLPVKTRGYDRRNKTMCCKCKVNERLGYHNYCKECKLESHKQWRLRQPPSKPFSEKRRKQSARSYINGLFARGKIKRQPCKHCSAPSVNFHHLSYHDRSVDIEHVCFKCHVQLERDKRKRLTERKERLNSVAIA